MRRFEQAAQKAVLLAACIALAAAGIPAAAAEEVLSEEPPGQEEPEVAELEPVELVVADGDGVIQGGWCNCPPGLSISAPGRLVAAEGQEFAESFLPFADGQGAADGTYSGQLLELDQETGEICVASYSFKLDATAPTLEGFSVVDGQGRQEGQGVFAAVVNGVRRLFMAPSVKIVLQLDDGAGSSCSGVSAAQLVKGSQRIDVHLGQQPWAVLGNSTEGALDQWSVQLTDAAGNTARYSLTGDELPVTAVADDAPPMLTVQWSGSQGREHDGVAYCNSAQTLTLEIEDEFPAYLLEFAPDQEVLRYQACGEEQVVTVGHFTQEDGRLVWSRSFQEEGCYQVEEAALEDLLGRPAQAQGSSAASFIIDTTAPSLEVVWSGGSLLNERYCNAPRQAELRVTDANLEPSLLEVEAAQQEGACQVGSWRVEEGTVCCTVDFGQEGVFSLQVAGQDLAGNALEEYASTEFVLDWTAPQVSFTGVQDQQACAGQAVFSAAVEDRNLSPSTTCDIQNIGITAGNPYGVEAVFTGQQMLFSSGDVAAVRENDGVYQACITALDLAGNACSATATWSVNRFGSTFLLGSGAQHMVQQGYLQSGQVQDVQITEINPSGLEVSQLTLRRDLSSTALQEGEDFQVSRSREGGWFQAVYQLPASLFAREGAYRLGLFSRDAAGNANSNASAEVQFAVDDTPPQIVLTGLPQELSAGSSAQAALSVSDAFGVEAVEALVDGQMVASWSGEQLAGGEELHFGVGGSSRARQVVVRAQDAAGNGAWEQRQVGGAESSAALFAGAAAGLVMVAAAAALLARRRRTSKRVG